MDYKELIEELLFLSSHVPEQMCDINGKDPLEEAATAIETLLAEMEKARVKHGKWLRTTKWWQGGSMWKKCSVCGMLNYKSPFCPSCGAKMDLQDGPTHPDRQQTES